MANQMRWGEQMGQQWRAKDEKNKTHKLKWRAPPLETIFFSLSLYWDVLRENGVCDCPINLSNPLIYWIIIFIL